MSAFIGVSLYKLFNLLSAEMFNKLHWLLCALSVSISLFCMQVTHTVHPPASATALIGVTGGPAIYDLGYMYVLCPVGLGVSLMLIVAILVNNVARRYPTHWRSPKTKMIAVIDQDMSTTIADFISSDISDDEESAKDVTRQAADPTAKVDRVNDSSRSSVTASPSVNDLTSQARSHPRQHHQGHFAVYYGGEHHEELKDHERMREEHGHSDLEHGQGHGRSAIVEKRGSTHFRTSEEEYQATIERLQHRIRELEGQLASAAK